MVTSSRSARATLMVPQSAVILVGGAPVTQQWADEIGADGFAPDAAASVDVALQFAAAA